MNYDIDNENENNQKNERKCGIYNIEGIKGKSKVKIVPVGLISLTENEYLADKLENRYDILDKVLGEVYICNIIDTFLMRSKKLPMMYISIILDKPMRRIFLFKIYVCFTITSEIKTSNDLLNKPIEGHFSLEVVIGKKHKEINKEIKKYPGLKEMVQILVDFVKADEMKDFIQDLVNEENNRLRKQFEDEYANYKIPKATISLNDYLD